MPAPLPLVIQTIKDVTVVSFNDRTILDAYLIERIAETLYELIEKQDRRRLILDFTEVRMLGSAALGVLLQLRRKAEQAKGRVALVGIAPALMKVFKITNLHKLFDFYDDEERALGAFGVTTAG